MALQDIRLALPSHIWFFVRTPSAFDIIVQSNRLIHLLRVVVFCIHVLYRTTITSLIAGHTAIRDIIVNFLPDVMAKRHKPMGKYKTKIKSKSKSRSKSKPESSNEALKVPEPDEYIGSPRTGGNFVYTFMYGEPSEVQRALRHRKDLETQAAQTESAAAPTKREIRNASLARRRERRTATFKPPGFYNESMLATASTGEESAGRFLKLQARSFKSVDDFNYRRFEIFCNRHWRLPVHEEGPWSENMIMSHHGQVLERSGLSRCGGDYDWCCRFCHGRLKE